MEKVLRYGIIGLGSMGRHHVRNVRALEGAELAVLSDPAGDRFGVAGDTPLVRTVDEAIEYNLDVAVVAVPTAYHFEAASALIRAGVNVLVEKPLANSLSEAEELVKLASEYKVLGGVGYVERCNPALLEMKRLISQDFLGQVYQISTRRQSPFPARISDVGVIKDLATHDVDLTAWVAGSPYKTVSAFTSFKTGREFEDMVVASGQLRNGVIVNHQVNWLTPYKDRSTIAIGENGALVAETVMGDLTFYENGSDEIAWDQVSNFRGVTEGTVTRFALKKREPLAVEHQSFMDCVLGRSTEMVSFKDALHTMDVVQSMIDSAASEKVKHL